MDPSASKLQAFLATKDPNLLEEPLVFGTNTSAFGNYLCCTGLIGCMASWGITALFCPIGGCQQLR
jgi:hypothetical protein